MPPPLSSSQNRGLTLIMDPKLIHFALNAHLSPQGSSGRSPSIDVKPRPLSDSSFRPWPGAMAINDWTNKKNEPKLYFAQLVHELSASGNGTLAITYPTYDRHTGDDNVQCAFPRLKYNPQLVAMHSSISNGNTLSMNTGLTFGDNTSPSNWEPIARARQQLAQHFWIHEPEMVMEKGETILTRISNLRQPATEQGKSRICSRNSRLRRYRRHESTTTLLIDNRQHTIITLMITCTATSPN